MEYQIGINAWGGDRDWVHNPTVAFLRSAYLEEVMPDYRRLTPESFIVLEPKSNLELWKHSIFSMGSAIGYVTKDNPFSPELETTQAWSYVWDTIIYLMIDGGILNGEAGFFTTSLLAGGLCRAYFVWPMQSHINYHNRIVTSGYGIPRYAQFDNLEARSSSNKIKMAGPGEKTPAPITAISSVNASDTSSFATKLLDVSDNRDTTHFTEKPSPKILKPFPFSKEKLAHKPTAGEKILVAVISPILGALTWGGTYYLMHGNQPGDYGLLLSGLSGATVGMIVGFSFMIDN